MEWFFTFLISFTIVVLLMPVFIKLMEKYKILDKEGGRKIHSGYTAHMGGIVIFIGFAGAFFFSLFSVRYATSMFNIIALFILFAVIAILGIRDDMNSLSPLRKLIFEIIVGVLICVLDIRLMSFGGFLGIGTLPVWLSYVLTIFFFIVVSNAYNLIDGIDGQAGLQAIASLGGVCLFLWWFLQNGIDGGAGLGNTLFWFMITAAMLGGIVGFLCFNWQKARIFMGDTGSLFIRFMIAIAIIVVMNLNTQAQSSVFSYEIKSNLGVILCFFFLPLADTLRVFILRIRKGKSPLYPDKTHIHHILLRVKNFSHQQCAITTFLIQVGVMLIMMLISLFFNDNIYAIIVFLAWVLYVLALKFLLNKNIKHNK